MTAFEKPLRVAIVGSGPSGFFCADYLLRLAQPCTVTMFERWPAPYGLVRGGVSPDHMHIRRVTRAFERIVSRPGFFFYGNLEIGNHLKCTDLNRFFDAVILCTGASQSRHLDIEGGTLAGCYGAADFAGWYNGRLDCTMLQPDFSGRATVIVGAGNAALDVARILCWPPSFLASTDISDAALAALETSTINDIHIVARRGPYDVCFTAQELALFGDIPDCKVILHAPEEMLADAPTGGEDLSVAYGNIINYTNSGSTPAHCIHLHFLLRPEALLGPDKVTGFLFRDSSDALIHIPCEMAIMSIGQTGEVIKELPFNMATGVIPNHSGRVIQDGQRVSGVYVAGWIKRGASGLIGTNKPDCRETVQSLMEDRNELLSQRKEPFQRFLSLLETRACNAISFDDWKVIEDAERRRGSIQARPRAPFLTVEAMLQCLGAKHES